MGRLADLCRVKEEALERYTLTGMTNAYGKTPEELAELDLALRKARNEYFLAMRAYEAALDAEANNS